MGDFTIPKKKSSEFPERRTISISSRMNLMLNELDQKGVDVPQLIRDSIEEYLKRGEIQKILGEGNGQEKNH